MACVSRLFFRQLGKNLLRRNTCKNVLENERFGLINFQGRRFLFSSELLGLDGYNRNKAVVSEQIGQARGSFFERVKSFLDESKSNSIFSDDLKIALCLGETEEEINLIATMIKRYHEKNTGMQLSTFIFGPVVMRFLHVANKPDIAMSLFKDQSLSGYFDQLTSFFVYMDLLYVNKMYTEVLDTMDILVEKKFHGILYPVDCLTLVAASCYKLNEAELIKRLLSYLQNAKSSGTNISMRTIVYSAMFAYNVKEPQLALEILSMTNAQQELKLPVAYLNAKALIYTDLGRYDETLNLLKSLVQGDSPNGKTKDVFQEVITKLVDKLEEMPNKSMVADVKRIDKDLKSSGRLMPFSFAKYLDSEVHRPKQYQAGYKHKERSHIAGIVRENLVPRSSATRPGLLFEN